MLSFKRSGHGNNRCGNVIFIRSCVNKYFNSVSISFFIYDKPAPRKSHGYVSQKIYYFSFYFDGILFF